jgi:hypothetical protein
MKINPWPQSSIDAAKKQILEEEDEDILNALTSIAEQDKYLSKIFKISFNIQIIKANL